MWAGVGVLFFCCCCFDLFFWSLCFKMILVSGTLQELGHHLVRTRWQGVCLWMCKTTSLQWCLQSTELSGICYLQGKKSKSPRVGPSWSSPHPGHMTQHLQSNFPTVAHAAMLTRGPGLRNTADSSFQHQSLEEGTGPNRPSLLLQGHLNRLKISFCSNLF